MTNHKLGLHWLRYHPRGKADFEHIERMQYRSVKVFEWMWNNRDFMAELLAVLPGDAYILARDHPLSEQKADMWRAPVATGVRHADEWAQKVRAGVCHVPPARTFFLGINEPDAVTGDRHAIDLYTSSFLRRLQQHGLRGGAFNFGTGHPRTLDGTPDTKPHYDFFQESYRALREGEHIAVQHIYGTGSRPSVPGHYNVLSACTWPEVTWVIGEFGIDEHVTGAPHTGYKWFFRSNLVEYCHWLERAISAANHERIHSFMVFSYDYSPPWESFDIRPIAHGLETYPWQHGLECPYKAHVAPPKPVPPATVPTPSTFHGVDPKVMAAIMFVESGQRTHGQDGRLIIRFEAHIFQRLFKNQEVWEKHFRVGNPPWQGQQWRPDEQASWRPIHTGHQNDEYAAFSFAQRLNREVAYQSISMGAPQIMGFNHARVGFASAEEMFQAFEREADTQYVAVCNFVLADGALRKAINQKDWAEIGRRYNGQASAGELYRQAYAELWQH